jgi:type II secretory pathway predicted ATPase ExeA
LTPQETADYIQYRLHTAGRQDPVFTLEAFRAVIGLSGGIPRRINHTCDLALMAGFSGGLHVIDHPVIMDVAKDLEL